MFIQFIGPITALAFAKRSEVRSERWDGQDTGLDSHGQILKRYSNIISMLRHSGLNVRPALEKWEKRENELPPGYQKIKCHFIFDIKMGENFRFKVRLMANAKNTTETPAALTWYSSMVS